MRLRRRMALEDCIAREERLQPEPSRVSTATPLDGLNPAPSAVPSSDGVDATASHPLLQRGQQVPDEGVDRRLVGFHQALEL